jgi:oxygen-independent coproporphyrinogen-3 oxidase
VVASTGHNPALGLYVHIPFCSSICNYCNFNRGLYDEALKMRYVAALRQEIAAAPAGLQADTIFFGGGTPSLLSPHEVRHVIATCAQHVGLTPDAEITLEANPETVTPALLAGFREAGVNRISFGVQSFDPEELRRLDRLHSADRAVQAIRDARAAGFANLSFDLMLWLPGQTLESWQQTIDRAIDLTPAHLSLYLLELYPNAPLREAMARSHDPALAQVSEDLAADMYLDGLARLDAAGYRQYEISNVARNGFESRHNLKYWQGGDWFGFGCGAHGTVDGRRWHNLASTTEYIARLGSDTPVRVADEQLTPQARLEEALFMGLRLADGIGRRNFQARFGVDPWSRHAEALRPHVEAGRVWTTDERFGLTREGMLVANDVLSLFV